MHSAMALILLAVAPWVTAARGATPEALEPASTGGITAVDRALARLSTHKRLLVIGAHPDDEDNTLLTYVSRALGGEAAYLSLSRGEGGQNLIGSELGFELGVIRTGELLAARRIEGTRQYFARAFDFGYTRSLEETFERWPREILREDAIRAAHHFKPQVVVAIFPADPRAGHGQHQASAMIAADVFELSGEEGWRPHALYRRAWTAEEATVVLDLGVVDPHAGRSVGQIAAESRSRHRSQDMGRIQPLGRGRGGLVWIAGAGEPAGSDAGEIFTGIDTRLAAIVEPMENGPAKTDIAEMLHSVERSAREARHLLSPVALAAAVDAIASIVNRLDEALALARSSSASVPVIELLSEKRQIAGAALAAAAGVAVEAVADREAAPPGGVFEITASIWPSSSVEVEIEAVRLVSPAGWPVEGGDQQREKLAPDPAGVTKRAFRVEVPASARPTVPYFFERTGGSDSSAGQNGDLYDWTSAASDVRGRAFGPAPVVAIFELRVQGAELAIEREVVFRYGDQAVGEVRRPLRVVPELEVAVAPRLVLSKVSGASPRAKEVEVVLRSNVERPLRGRLQLDLPAGWSNTAAEFEIGDPFGTVVSTLSLTPAADTAPGLYPVSVAAVLDGGVLNSGTRTVMSGATPRIEYPHIRPVQIPRPARLTVGVLHLEPPVLDLVGYVPGASDRVPPVLEQLGLPVRILDRADLEHGDLDRFDTIVIGSRAYEIDDALRRANGRLLEYARRGGTLIVQYQQYQYVAGGFAPFPIEISRPHGRVTDETAPVRALAPDHPIFHRPNRIEAADWDGWVQERGLYFGATWDERYTPLLEMADAGRAEERGSLLVAPLGEGTYVYTGLSFFRQLPAGVPGAIRLFVNLLGLGS